MAENRVTSWSTWEVYGQGNYDNLANKEPFLNQLACVILVHNWYRSTSTCFHVYPREYMCSACCHKFWTSLTRVILGWNWYGFTAWYIRVIMWKTRDFTINTCWHTKFVHRIRWIKIRKHVNWACRTWEFTYRTCTITGRCLLGTYVYHRQPNEDVISTHMSNCVRVAPVRSGVRAVERRTINRGDSGSIPLVAVSKLRQFCSPHIACVFWKRH